MPVDFLQAASAQNKYQVTWVELAPVQFEAVVTKWLDQLSKSAMSSGPFKAQRIGLADQFYRLLHIQQQLLSARPTAGTSAMEVARAGTNIQWFAAAYKKKFGDRPALTQPTHDSSLQSLMDQRHMLSAKLGLLDAKLQLINFWIQGAQNFPEHRDGTSLMFQYMGNAPKAKVRLFLDVLCEDAEKAVRIADPAAFKMSFERQAGFKTAGEDGKLGKIEWTNTAFERVVKAEVGASYGASASGACELEFKGIKASLSAEAWAGARAKAEGTAGWTAGSGGTVKGSVDAEIGIKLSATAALDCADIFLCEASAEAFAGAMAHGEVEITATVNRVAVKIGAEAFAGARITGKAKMTFKIQGYELISTEATGSLSAGIGAVFEMGFECAALGGTKLKLKSGVTVGVGGEVGTTVDFNSQDVAAALQSLYFTSYLSWMGRSKEKHAFVEYFRDIQDNVRLFERGRAVIEDQMKVVIIERNNLFSRYSEWKQLEGLAAFRATGTV